MRTDLENNQATTELAVGEITSCRMRDLWFASKEPNLPNSKAIFGVRFSLQLE